MTSLTRKLDRARNHYKNGTNRLPPRRDTRVRVSHVLETDDNSQSYRVKVDSVVKPGLVMHIDVPITASRVEHTIMLSAGAIAEALNDKHKDELDPDLIAKMASAAFRDLIHRTSLNQNAERVGISDA